MENFRNINPVRVDKTTIINLEKGKLPPQVLELEEAVLGAMMIDKKGVDEVIDILQPDAFYKDAHKHIFEAIVQLFTDTQPIDLLTVSAQLQKKRKTRFGRWRFLLNSTYPKNIIFGTYRISLENYFTEIHSTKFN
jgi:replicative DNA helicase